MRTATNLFFLLFLGLTSCGVQMDARKLWDQLPDAEAMIQPSGRAEFRGPLKLGVAPPLLRSQSGWGVRRGLDAWTESERDVIRTWAEEFKEKRSARGGGLPAPPAHARGEFGGAHAAASGCRSVRGGRRAPGDPTP